MESNYAGLGKRKLQEMIPQGSLKQLSDMWPQLEKEGYSKNGQLYASILRRRVELGDQLSKEEQELIGVAEVEGKRGAALPPIGAERGPAAAPPIGRRGQS